ncbi:hypothetical protein SFIMM107S_00563 [Streptomyces griseus]
MPYRLSGGPVGPEVQVVPGQDPVDGGSRHPEIGPSSPGCHTGGDRSSPRADQRMGGDACRRPSIQRGNWRAQRRAGPGASRRARPGRTGQRGRRPTMRRPAAKHAVRRTGPHPGPRIRSARPHSRPRSRLSQPSHTPGASSSWQGSHSRMTSVSSPPRAPAIGPASAPTRAIGPPLISSWSTSCKAPRRPRVHPHPDAAGRRVKAAGKHSTNSPSPLTAAPQPGRAGACSAWPHMIAATA